jgi:hypothetical protein
MALKFTDDLYTRVLKHTIYHGTSGPWPEKGKAAISENSKTMEYTFHAGLFLLLQLQFLEMNQVEELVVVYSDRNSCC